jgi:hypothetical protein
LRKFKKFAQSRWHSIPLGAMAIALVAALLVTGTVFALTIGSWTSPTITVTTKPLLTITSSIDGAGISKYTGAVTPVTVTIYNPASESYSGITTKMMVTKTGIVPSDVVLEEYNLTVADDWFVIPLVQDGANMLSFSTPTSTIPAWGTDVTEFRITFNTDGVYQASASLTN